LWTLFPPEAAEEHGTPYLAWELRGGRVCIEPEQRSGGEVPRGVRYVIAPAGTGAPYTGLRRARPAGPYVLWERRGAVRGSSDCPLIAVREARQGRG